LDEGNFSFYLIVFSLILIITQTSFDFYPTLDEFWQEEHSEILGEKKQAYWH